MRFKIRNTGTVGGEPSYTRLNTNRSGAILIIDAPIDYQGGEVVDAASFDAVVAERDALIAENDKKHRLFEDENQRALLLAAEVALLRQELQATEGTWAWALEQMKAGKQLTRASEPYDAPIRINKATGLLVRPDSDRPVADKAAWFFDDDFSATDWQIVL